MRWKRGSSSGNTIDARGSRAPGRVAIPSGLGLVGVLVFVAFQLLSGGSGFAVPSAFDDGAQAPDGGAIPAGQDPEKDLRDFSEYVFDSAQTTWTRTFGGGYEDAKLYLYRDAVRTACGSATSAVGPFYCPADQRVYLDLSFYGDMERELGAPGDFAWAYVIAHEVGHHVQQQLGTSTEVSRLQRERPDDANALSVRLELQADCYAGVWAHSVFAAGDLEKGDIREAIRASGAVGDDRLQRRAGGQVNPDTFTHGTSEQRTDWFNRGRTSGSPDDCDTFSPEEL